MENFKDASVVNNMAQQELQKGIMAAFVQHGISDVQDTANVRKAIIEMIPASSRGNYANEDAMVYAAIDAYFAGQPDTTSTGTPAATQVSSAPTTLNIDPAQQKAIIDRINKETNDRMNVTNSSKITKVLFDKEPANKLVKTDQKDLTVTETRKTVGPDGKEIDTGEILHATMVFPKDQLDTLNKYAPAEEGAVGHIDPKDKTSIENWNALKNAIAAGTPLDLHISTEYGTPVGVVLEEGSTQEGAAAVGTSIMTKRDLTVFLTQKAYGVVPTNADSALGARLQITTPKNSKKGDKNLNGVKIGTPAAKIAGVKEAVKLGANAYEVTSEFAPASGQAPKMTLTSELSFKVTSKRKKNEGEVDEAPIMRTVRARVQVESKPIQRKTAYVSKFGACETNRNIIAAPLSDAERQKVAQTLQSAQLSLANDVNVRNAFGKSAQDILGDIANVKTEASSAAFA